MERVDHYTYDQIEAIAKLVQSKSADVRPEIAIICGTGLGGLADLVDSKTEIAYEEIPSFPRSTVQGHAGKLILGRIHKKPVICMKGRFHLYEGYHMAQVTLPVQVMHLLGVKTLIVTNAAGGLNSDYKVGDMMILKDHIFMPGLAGQNPLVGPNDERFGPRFPAMSELYTMHLRELARTAAKELNLTDFIREGVYAMIGGPSFETIAECRMLQAIGADVVGMSTCPEAVVAAHCGMQVFGMSLVTNQCVVDYNDNKAANHEEVLETGKERAHDIQSFVLKIIQLMPDSTV